MVLFATLVLMAGTYKHLPVISLVKQKGDTIASHACIKLLPKTDVSLDRALDLKIAFTNLKKSDKSKEIQRNQVKSKELK